MLPKRVPIPPTFHDDETDAPFESCLACDQPLRRESTDYVIEKGYRAFDEYDVQETVFGYALCMRCHASLSESFSEASKRRCQSYLNEHIDLRERSLNLLEKEEPEVEKWTDHCIIHGTPKSDLQEYQLLAHCREDKMLLTHLPLMIGGTAVEELAERLSKETKDELGGFRDEYFGLPPELQKNLHGPVLA